MLLMMVVVMMMMVMMMVTRYCYARRNVDGDVATAREWVEMQTAACSCICQP
jgi:hypothetical protein